MNRWHLLASILLAAPLLCLLMVCEISLDNLERAATILLLASLFGGILYAYVGLLNLLLKMGHKEAEKHGR